jgi:two-component system response regulator YesN
MGLKDMITMIIVDDDELERASLKSYIDWAFIGVKVIGEASNGSLGLNRFLELHPDIVLCDVMMPSMGGLEMAEKILQINSFAEIIFLSSFCDFEFAQKAISLKAFAYVTKPVIEDELLKIVKHAADRIIENVIEKETYRKLKSNYKVSLALARQEIVNQMLLGIHDCREEANKLGLGWVCGESGNLCLLLSFYNKEENLVAEDIQLLNQKLLQLYMQSISICLNPGMIATLFSVAQKISDETVTTAKKILADFFNERRLTDIKITAEYENDKNIKTSNLYSKIMERHSGSTPYSSTLLNSKRNNKEQIIKEIEKVIDENYSKPLTVETIAKMIHFTPNYIGLIFKNEKKISINHYIMDVRLQRSKELLANENIRVNDIALQCGYENITYFHTTFKKELGITPNEYRQRILLKCGPNNVWQPMEGMIKYE